ncbi:hypothetical protein LCGC14_0952320, partial [marine sediment metagenome]
MTTRTLLKTTLATALMLTSLSSFAEGALSVDKHITVNANATTVWKMVGNFNGLDVWHPLVVNSELKTGSNNQPGAERGRRVARDNQRAPTHSGAVGPVGERHEQFCQPPGARRGGKTAPRPDRRHCRGHPVQRDLHSEHGGDRYV